MSESFAKSRADTFTVRQSAQKALGWVSLILFGLAAVLAVRADAFRPLLVFLFLACVAVYLILSTGQIQMNAEAITSRLPLGTFRIRWDEIQTIEYDYKRSSMIFTGWDRRLAISGPITWTGKDRAQMLSLVEQQVQAYRIQIVVSGKGFFKWSRNVRVRT